jgi:hypothetical protein
MDRRNSESEDVGLQPEGEQEKEIRSGDLNIEMNLDAINDVRKKYKKIKRYMRSSIYTVAMMDGKEKIVNGLLGNEEDNPT